jgi:hypothetical protein
LILDCYALVIDTLRAAVPTVIVKVPAAQAMADTWYAAMTARGIP